ncbi:protein MRG1-like isoform X1 [Punica granatum]|uniref:Protein MRG1-like isoform X1 n=1 Tax=Punica granatum TaxID=22663 RepID=A0A6P8EBB5_PUNGR|nr:protein MRG1-like isoform X1 [Punica granatum]
MAGSSRTGADDDSANESNGTATTMSGSDTERDDESPPDLASSPFKEGEKVLAFHSCHIYEAKVKKVDYQRKQWRYNIHYLGWNKSWDEWVGVDRLLKYTEENIERQEANNKKQGLEKNIKAGRGSQVKPKSSNAPRGKKRKSDSAIKEKDALPTEKLVSIHIPTTLKKQLIHDCEYITHLGKLVKLPRSPTVEEILQKYFDHRLKKDGSAEPVKEIMQGLRSYFDKALPLMLLYKSERPQYEEAVGDKVLPACVYGAEHLLRLFVKLPELLFHVNIEEETLTELQHNLVDFLRFLQKNQNTFFLSAYQVPEEIETSTNKKAN